MELNLKHAFESIDSLMSKRGLGYLLFASLFSLGPLEVFVAYPERFDKMELAKLILLALALVLPPMFASVVAYVVGENKRLDESGFQQAFSLSGGTLLGMLIVGILWTKQE